jgi:hypothetical protein
VLIQYAKQDHQQGWPEMAAMFPGLEKAQMPGEEAWASERLTCKRLIMVYSVNITTC